MNTQVEMPAVQQTAVRTAKPAKKVKARTYVFLFMAWTLLIAAGALGAKMYAEYLKQQITQEIAEQTQQQLKIVQDDYAKQLDQLKESVNGDVAKLQTKVDSLNELLAFTKDSANSKTDNSNQLYTQLADVKKKLDELKKNLDVLQ